MLRPWITLLLITGVLLIAGCAHLHVDSVPQWQTLTSSRLCLTPESNPDYRNLVTASLQQGGWQVTGECTGNEVPDTIVADYQLQWVVDLDAESQVIQRPASFHLQLHKVADNSLLAVADYFYPNPPDDISAGIKEACNALAHRAELPSPDEAPTAKQVPTEPTVSSPASLVEENAGAVSPVEKQVTEPPSTESSPAEVKPMQTSPWVPRLKSWGFEGWGDSAQDDKLQK